MPRAASFTHASSVATCYDRKIVAVDSDDIGEVLVTVYFDIGSPFARYGNCRQRTYDGTISPINMIDVR
jgi:hypothetical protein